MVTTILAKMLEPVFEAMPAEFARALLKLRIDERLEARIEVLRHKANAGQLSTEEKQEYEEFLSAVDILSLLQLKAEKILSARTP